MIYRVIWLEKVISRLRSIAVDLKSKDLDPQRFLLALQRVELGLINDPLSFGESREGADRLWYEGPLEIRYEVHESAEVVVVH